MHRVIAFSIITAILLFAGSVFSPNETPPAGALIAAATTQHPTSVPATQPPLVQPTLQTGWLSQLEIIKPQNWARLQLLKTFPAEMPMTQSAVTFMPDGKTMVMGSNTSAKLFFFDLESGKLSRTLVINGVKNPNTPFKTIEVLSDGTFMANSDRPYAVYHIDPTGNVLTVWNSIYFAVSADEKTLALDTNEGTIVVNDTEETPVALLRDSNGYGFSFSPDTSKIAIEAVTEDFANVDIWDIKSQARLKTLPDMYRASYSPDGKFLVAAVTDDGSLKVFSPDGAVQITTILDAHADYVISPDGSILAYQTAKDPSVAMDTTNWKPFETALRGKLYAFSPDGRILITRTDDGGILVWGILKE
jgi:WD40 repeat protein